MSEDHHLIQDQRPEGSTETLGRTGTQTVLVKYFWVFWTCGTEIILPGPLGDRGPDRGWLPEPAGDGDGEGEGPVRAGGGRRGETWGEKGEQAPGVPWSP